MKLIRKTILRTIPVLILVPSLLFYNRSSSYATINRKALTDSGRYSSKEREVLTSQQLFVVEMTRARHKSVKHTLVNFKAELKDVFTIVCYEKDTSYTELKWTMCPGGVCPVTGTFKFGTPGYKKLDALIAQTKQNEIVDQKKTNALIADAKKRGVNK
ncbi:hypothetical protein ACFGVS_09855 [Mucilaginibacter sp. AW1-7]|uniref:hypothetical protein n=1 Tax=Mucilaginibacter sp. AW1-7 TaxID=3349874 RepID=UPI003F7324BA